MSRVNDTLRMENEALVRVLSKMSRQQSPPAYRYRIQIIPSSLKSVKLLIDKHIFCCQAPQSANYWSFACPNVVPFCLFVISISFVHSNNPSKFCSFNFKFLAACLDCKLVYNLINVFHVSVRMYYYMQFLCTDDGSELSAKSLEVRSQ